MQKISVRDLAIIQKKFLNTVNSGTLHQALYQYAPNFFFLIDNNGIIYDVSKGLKEILGYSKEEILALPLDNLFIKSENSTYKAFMTNVLAGVISQTATIFLHKDKKNIPIDLKGVPIINENVVTSICVLAKESTAIKSPLTRLDDLNLPFQTIVEQAFIGVYIIDTEGFIVYGNIKFLKLLGIEFTEYLNLFDYIHPEDLSQQKSLFESLKTDGNSLSHSFRLNKIDGKIHCVEAHSCLVKKNKSVIVGVLQDKTEQKEMEELNHFLAYYDCLTGLPNRVSINENINKELVISKTMNNKFALLFLDLDRFKYLNDTLGHSIGDELLKQVSVRLQNCISDGNGFLGRLGGDEFAVILSNISNVNHVIEIAETILKSLADIFYIEPYEFFITASIGISIYPTDGEDLSTLTKYADSALYKAKEKGKNTYQIFTPSLITEYQRTFTLERDLRKAINLNQFEIYYQPKVNAINQKIVGAEALLRWNHPKWGLVSPAEFIPLAEEIGLSADIGKWIKKSVISQIKFWKEAGLPLIPISLNLSASQFFEIDLVTYIRNALESTHLLPEYVELEITESLLLDNEKNILFVLDKLKELGIRIALDDFGTGYSSLSYLKKFKGRINILKIDQSFIQGISNDNSDRFILKSIIELAHHLDMDVVAEGVEIIEQFELLKEYQCNSIQGFLFSKPLPAEEFKNILKTGKIELSKVTIADKKNTFVER